ncbi:hypothetical protein SKAU_G00065980 [Synaphobranchus kaupii]|uniref:Uncharacterized protein n=1 Tax=Synaphobranchus kaupii TaxID=118154 RepID=A0A9Q1G6M9_SYNKA|nr:hypothetical protein SKAU_G00065980 [Synaphobranchus kaupii]
MLLLPGGALATPSARPAGDPGRRHDGSEPGRVTSPVGAPQDPRPGCSRESRRKREGKQRAANGEPLAAATAASHDSVSARPYVPPGSAVPEERADHLQPPGHVTADAAGARGSAGAGPSPRTTAGPWNPPPPTHFPPSPSPATAHTSEGTFPCSGGAARCS